MASESSKSPLMELWTSVEVAKPEPLRIVKRAKTFAVRVSAGEVPIPIRKSSRSSDSIGSSPEGSSIPLTIRKKRKARGSILDGNFIIDSTRNRSDELLSFLYPLDVKSTNGSFVNMAESDLLKVPDIPQSNGTTITPRSESNKCSTSYSNGSGSSLDVAADPESTPNGRLQCEKLRKTVGPPERVTSSPLSADNPSISRACMNGEVTRRLSRPKALMNKAFGSLRQPRAMGIKSNSSKVSLLRRMSSKNRRQSHARSQTQQSVRSSSSSSRLSFYDGNSDTVIFQTNSITPSGPDLGVREPPYMLYPRIRITPELESVESGGNNSLWVAVTITGCLHGTADTGSMPWSRLNSTTSWSNQRYPGQSQQFFTHLQ